MYSVWIRCCFYLDFVLGICLGGRRLPAGNGWIFVLTAAGHEVLRVCFLLPPRRSPVVPGLALPAATQESEVDLSNRHKVGTRSEMAKLVATSPVATRRRQACKNTGIEQAVEIWARRSCLILCDTQGNSSFCNGAYKHM